MNYTAVQSKKLVINCTARVAADLPMALPQISWSIALDGGGATNNIRIFSNGTLVIPRVNRCHRGIYNCSAEYDGEIIVASVINKGWNNNLSATGTDYNCVLINVLFIYFSNTKLDVD